MVAYIAMSSVPHLLPMLIRVQVQHAHSAELKVLPHNQRHSLHARPCAQQQELAYQVRVTDDYNRSSAIPKLQPTTPFHSFMSCFSHLALDADEANAHQSSD